MSDYIKRNDALGLAYNISKKGGSANNVYFGLKQLKVADVAPVRHGEWIKISPAGIYECSECGKNVMTSDIEAYEYCHGCGAIMDEKKNDETT